MSASIIDISGGTITHSPQTATEAPWETDAAVNLEGHNITIGPDATINVTAKGFSGGVGAKDGNGPGGGQPGTVSHNNYSGGGGGYGGHGGQYDSRGLGGATYGDRKHPLLPGSGGGGRNGYTYGASAGGGLVLLTAQNDLIINGTITANGGNAPAAYLGAGSGGGIYLRARVLRGTGTVSAAGGTAGANSGAGGGGRIALWRAAERATLNLSVGAGSGTNQNGLEAGTIFRNAPYGSIVVIK